MRRYEPPLKSSTVPAAELGGTECAGKNGKSSDGHPGLGIVGMRERVSALGGQFTAGPRPVRGFRVEARLPIRAEDEA